MLNSDKDFIGSNYVCYDGNPLHENLNQILESNSRQMVFNNNRLHQSLCFGLSISSGRTYLSKSSSLNAFSSMALCFKVKPLLWAFFATFEAES